MIFLNARDLFFSTVIFNREWGKPNGCPHRLLKDVLHFTKKTVLFLMRSEGV